MIQFKIRNFFSWGFGNVTLEINKVKEDIIELVSNQIYDKITKLINDRINRLGINGGA